MRGLGNARGAADALAMLGRVHGESGRLDEAKAFLDEALAASQELGDKGKTAFALYGLAHISKARGDYYEARQLFGESLDRYRETGEPVSIGEWIEGWAAVCCATDHSLEGVLALAAAESLRQSLGLPLASLLIDEHARSVAPSLDPISVINRSTNCSVSGQ